MERQRATQKIINRGQVMLVSVIMLGGILASAVGIAGVLMVFQIRQSNEAAQSAAAFYAADAGLEWATYNGFNATAELVPPTFSNGTTVSASSSLVNNELRIQSIGMSGNAARALEAGYSVTE
jgi:threonine/homoserine efflux transporter RhtA